MTYPGWDNRVDPPIQLPEGGAPFTLRAAQAYMAALPVADQQQRTVQAAVHVLPQGSRS